MVNFLWENIFNKDQKDKELTKVLKSSYLFNSLTPVELHFVKKLVHIRKYKPGERVFLQGDVGVGMYIVLSGNVDIELDTPPSTSSNTTTSLHVTRLSTGDFFGELALAEENNIRSASATAVDHVSLVGFFKPELLEITERTPSAGVKILTKLGEVLGKRLKKTSHKISELKLQIDRSDSDTEAL